MPTVDLEISSIVSENFAVGAIRMQDDEGAKASALNTQIAICELDDLPANADTVTSVTIHIEANVNPTKTIASLDLKLINSSGTMLRENGGQNVDNPSTAVIVHTSDTWTNYISGGAVPSWNTSVVNDMRLQVKHAGNVSGTPTLELDYAFVRVVYTETSSVATVTYDTTVKNTHISSGNLNVTSGNIFI